MAKIINMEGLTADQLNREIQNGAKFVIFQYCISIIILTFKRPSGIYFIRANESVIKHSISFTLLSVLFGWWGIPWGPIYTIGSLHTNFSGGKDVTAEVLNTINSHRYNPQ
jgi:hypothetical protein